MTERNKERTRQHSQRQRTHSRGPCPCRGVQAKASSTILGVAHFGWSVRGVREVMFQSYIGHKWESTKLSNLNFFSVEVISEGF